MKLKVTTFLLAMSAVAAAQSSSGYLFFAPGGVTVHGQTESMFHAGGGGDVHIVKGLAANAELGFMFHKNYLDSVVGVFSPGGAYYFRRGSDHKIEPFVNTGYTMFFRSGHQNLWYVGAGANWWITGRFGLRFELRDHLYFGPTDIQFWNVRVALAFR